METHLLADFMAAFNRNRLDNRRQNLRFATKRENAMNTGAPEPIGVSGE